MADELYFGVPEPELGRVARLEADPAGMALFASLSRDLPLFKANPPAVTPGPDFANRTDVLTADIPSGGTLSARAIARMYAALLSRSPEVRPVTPSVLAGRGFELRA